MFTVIFLILSVVSLLATLLFMLSNSEMDKLNNTLNKSFGAEMTEKIGEVFNRRYDIDKEVWKYRRGVAICFFLICVFLFVTALYFV
ncbi:MAG: hypothetical protein JW844_06505 [Candidatus Omnitrophica bacterium]|nr:hypothetical protein [Candidatus Omnitrophota bacterium]